MFAGVPKSRLGWSGTDRHWTSSCSTVKPMKRDWTPEAQLARSALIVAAMRRTFLTYGELGSAIGMSGIQLPHHMGHVLDRLSEICIDEEDCSISRTARIGRSPRSDWLLLPRSARTFV